MYRIIHVQIPNNTLEQSKISSQNSSIMKRCHHPMLLLRVTFALCVYAVHLIKMGKFMLTGGVPRLHRQFYSQDKAAGGALQEYIQDPFLYCGC